MIQQQLREEISKIMELYQEHESYYLSNEMATREQLINPLLNILGWYTSNPKFVRPNQRNELGDIPDYTLWKNDRKVLVIEAKKVSIEVKDTKVIDQLIKYTYNMGIKFGIVSNGLKWLLFDTFEQNPSQRIVWELDFKNSADNYETESKKLSSISYSGIETLEDSIKRIKLENFWDSKLSTEKKLVSFISSAINENIQTELSIALNEIEDFVREKLANPKPKGGKRKPQTNIEVTFTDGTVIFNKRACDTFAQVIEKIGGENVRKLNLSQNGIALVGLTKHETYQQYKIAGGYYVMTHSSTENKLTHLNTINKRLNLNLKIEIK